SGSGAPPEALVALDARQLRTRGLRRVAKLAMMGSNGLGCRDRAAEIKPIEPVWVIPAREPPDEGSSDSPQQAARGDHRRRRHWPCYRLATEHAWRSRCTF